MNPKSPTTDMMSSARSAGSRISGQFYSTSKPFTAKTNTLSLSKKAMTTPSKAVSSSEKKGGSPTEGGQNPQLNDKDKAMSSISWMKDGIKTINSTKNVFGAQTTSLAKPEQVFCVDCLKEGCLEAFILLFEISHRKPVLIDPIADTYFSVPEDQLEHLKNMLIDCEKMKQTCEFEKAYQILKQIADYFESSQDMKTAIFFHQKGQQVAKTSGDIYLEGLAFQNLGEMFERHGDINLAIKAHEAHLALAKIHINKKEADIAREHLVKIYSIRAKSLSSSGSPDKAVKVLEAAHRVAKEGNNLNLLKKTTFDLADVLFKSQSPIEALEYQNQFLELCQQTNDEAGLINGKKKLGEILENMGNFEEALQIYREVLEKTEIEVPHPTKKSSAKKGNFGEDVDSPAGEISPEIEEIDPEKLKKKYESQERLGNLLLRMNQPEEAAKNWELNFEIAKLLGNFDLMNKARVAIGLANATAHEKKFFGL